MTTNSALICKKNFAYLHNLINQKWNSIDAAQSAANSIYDILQRCVQVNSSINCRLQLGQLHLQLSMKWNSIDAVQNYLKGIVTILINCVPLNKTPTCEKNITSLNSRFATKWNSLDEVQNVVISILYILEHCVIKSSSFDSGSELLNADGLDEYFHGFFGTTTKKIINPNTHNANPDNYFSNSTDCRDGYSSTGQTSSGQTWCERNDLIPAVKK